jgi:hypothetical protein
MSNGGLDMIEPTKESREILVEAMDSFSNNIDVKEINYVISKKIPKEKIRFSKYRSNRGKEELVRSQNKGIEYLSNNKTPSLPPPQTQPKTKPQPQTFNLLPLPPPQTKPQSKTQKYSRFQYDIDKQSFNSLEDYHKLNILTYILTKYDIINDINFYVFNDEKIINHLLEQMINIINIMHIELILKSKKIIIEDVKYNELIKYSTNLRLFEISKLLIKYQALDKLL